MWVSFLVHRWLRFAVSLPGRRTDTSLSGVLFMSVPIPFNISSSLIISLSPHLQMSPHLRMRFQHILRGKLFNLFHLVLQWRWQMVRKEAEWKDRITTMLLAEAIPFYSSFVYLRTATTPAFLPIHHTRLKTNKHQAFSNYFSLSDPFVWFSSSLLNRYLEGSFLLAVPWFSFFITSSKRQWGAGTFPPLLTLPCQSHWSLSDN